MSVPQRCAAWFLVWDSHRPGPQVANPFLPVLLEGVAAGGAAPPETALLLRLLQGADVEQVCGSRHYAAVHAVAVDVVVARFLGRLFCFLCVSLAVPCL